MSTILISTTTSMGELKVSEANAENEEKQRVTEYTLTHRDDIIHKFLNTVKNADPDLFIIEELKNRIKSTVCDYKLKESLNANETKVSALLNDMKAMFLNHNKDKIGHSLKRILKLMAETPEGVKVIEKWIE